MYNFFLIDVFIFIPVDSKNMILYTYLSVASIEFSEWKHDSLSDGSQVSSQFVFIQLYLL